MSSSSRRTASAPVSSVMAVSLISMSGNRLRTSVSAKLMMCGPSRNGMPTRSSPVTPVALHSDASAARSSTTIRSACSTRLRAARVRAIWLAFAIVELRVSEPLLELRLFKIPAFTGAALVAVIALCGFMGMVYSMSVRLGVIQGQSSLRVGLMALMINILAFALLPILPRVLYRFDVRVVLGAGTVFMAIGQFWLSTIPISDAGLGTLAAPLMPCGLGFVLIVSSVSGAAVNSVELSQAGMASGAINMMRDLGQALGIAVMGAVALSVSAASLPAQLAKSGLPPQAIAVVNAVAKAAGPFAVAHANLGPKITPHSIAAGQAALWHGYSEALVITGILSLVAFVITIALVRQPSVARDADQNLTSVPAEA